MRKVLLGFSLFLISLSAISQDTIFVNKHHFTSPVQNVFEAKESVYAKTTLMLYRFEKGNWEPVEDQFTKPYIFFNENFYESDFIPDSELFDLSAVRDLLPQKGQFIATSAIIDSRLFISSGGELFEYEIRDHYSRSYHNNSIRDIYIEDSLKVISTYSGIFVNDSIRLEEPHYSNGPLSKIDSIYYLAWDELSLFFPLDSIVTIPKATGLFSGKVRKIISWNEQVYALHTKSISQMSSNFDLNPLHQGLEYLDLESYDSGLVFSTTQGFCLSWKENKIDTLASLNTKIKDLYPLKNRLILSTDLGVFEILDGDPSTIKQIAKTPNTVMTILDDFDNLWISTENGLYVLDPDHNEPILIIPNVEFNREALLLTGKMLYIGGVSGLYTLDTYEIEKSYIPRLVNALDLPINEQITILLFFSVLFVFLVLLYLFFPRKKSKNNLSLVTQSDRNEYNLVEIGHKIINERIQTVETLASSLATNTVQLNRNFKHLGITPGKFLKKVKLNHARKLLQAGRSIEDVSRIVGYSEKYIRVELDKDI